MMRAQSFAIAAVGLSLVAVGVVGAVSQEKRATAAAGDYPKPRHPAPPPVPKTVDDLMPYARTAVRNKSGMLGQGMGILRSGESVLLVGTAASDDLVVQAVKRALVERKITVHLLYDFELAGVSREDSLALRKAAEEPATTEQGYLEAAGWVGRFPGGEGAAWLKQRRPEVHAQLFPRAEVKLPPALVAAQKKLRGSGRVSPVALGILAWLEKHPEVRGMFFGGGGPVWVQFSPHEDKWLGTFTIDTRGGLTSPMTQYPADVWLLSEERTMDPLAYVERVEINDPEGTAASFEVTPEQAGRWAQGVYLRGHLMMFPQQTYGRFGQSVIDYPAFTKAWIPVEPMVFLNGVVAGTKGHGGFYPRMELHYKDGYLREAKGGGLYGETLREFMKYPRINEVTYPFFKHPGYFYHFETALGSNPKAIRMPLGRFGNTSPERMRDGVFHWGLGIELKNDPESREWSDEAPKFARENKVPEGHGFHVHTYFTTYKAYLRGANRSVTLVDKGRLASLDSPEVRALASRYGNPDEVLSQDWVPEMPGVNAPGRYEDYAKDPFRYEKAVEDKVKAGTYDHIVKPRAAR